MGQALARILCPPDRGLLLCDAHTLLLLRSSAPPYMHFLSDATRNSTAALTRLHSCIFSTKRLRRSGVRPKAGLAFGRYARGTEAARIRGMSNNNSAREHSPLPTAKEGKSDAHSLFSSMGPLSKSIPYSMYLLRAAVIS